MTPDPRPSHEADRLRVLNELQLLGTGAEERFDALTRLLHQHLRVPMAWLALIDRDRVWLKAELGIGLRELPRGGLLCDLAIGDGDFFQIPDTRLDPRCVGSPWVDGTLALRFYAAVPLPVQGQRVALLGVADRAPRELDNDERAFLHDVSRLAVALLESEHRERGLRLQNSRLRSASLSSNDWLWETDAEGHVTWISQSIEAHTGQRVDTHLGRRMLELSRPCALDETGSWDRFIDNRQRQEPFQELITELDTPRGLIYTSMSGVPVFNTLGQFRGYRGATTNITDKLEARSAARRAEQLLNDALDGLSAGVMVCDAHGRVLLTNPHWRDNMHHLPETAHWPEMVRQMVARGDYPDAVGREQAFYDWRLGIVSDLGEQHEMRWRDEWLIVSARRLSNGNVVHMSWDITQRKQTELVLAEQQMQLRDSQDKLRAVLDAVPDLWFVLDAAGHYLECSDAHHPMLAHRWDDVKDRPLSAGVPQRVADTALAAMRTALRTGELQRIEYMLTTRDGVQRTFEARLSPMPGQRVLYVTRDLTQQRAAEQALRLAEERWNFALEGSGNGVWDWDLRSNAVFYSPRWAEMTGHRPIDLDGSFDDWAASVHRDDVDAVLHELQRHLRGETPVYHSEHRLQHRDGQTVWVTDRGKIVERAPDGRPLRLVGTRTDVTLDRQAEQVLRAKRAAELASHAKSEFLSRMSHEMRTPLNAVIGFSQLLKLDAERLPPPLLQSYVDHVLTAGHHLLALINDVLDLQKVEEGALSLALQPVRLADAVLRTIELLTPMAHERGVRFEPAVSSELWVRADAQRLRQVLLNLCSNALKYNRPGGKVRVSAQRLPRGRLTLLIEDTGAGMTADQMSRLFQPFERLGRETSTIEGTGLGLIIARSLTQAIGGRLDVASQPGEGTRVTLQLRSAARPGDEAPADDGPSPEREPEPRSRHPLRMLYVEDNRINAILFEEALRLHGSHVELRIAEDGEEALEAASEWRPEVLVLDAHLPGMSGFEVLLALRALPGLATTPAYMCSADAMPDDVQRAYEAGFVGYWTKPVDIAKVLDEIDGLMSTHATAKQEAADTQP